MQVLKVPALCTHRPSLLPIEWFSETFGLESSVAASISHKNACTVILLAVYHSIFCAVFPLIEYLVCPRFSGGLLYVTLTSVVFVTFDFINLMIHPLLYGFYVNLIWYIIGHCTSGYTRCATAGCFQDIVAIDYVNILSS